MAAAPTPLSLDEFHRLYDDKKPYYEYWFGEVRQKPMPKFLHGAMQFIIMFLLHARGWNAFPEIRLKLHPEAEPVPDVIALRKGETVENPYPTKPFGLCIEIVSPGDSLKKLFKKAEYYVSWGVSYVWIIDPQMRTAWMIAAEAKDPIWIHPDGALRADDTELPLQELFAELDKKMSGVLLADEDFT